MRQSVCWLIVLFLSKIDFKENTSTIFFKENNYFKENFNSKEKIVNLHGAVKTGKFAKKNVCFFILEEKNIAPKFVNLSL